MPDYGEQDRQCPFYRSTERSGRVGIICEGLFSDTTRHSFSCLFWLEAHQRKYCDNEDSYQQCPHAVALFRKHGYQPPKKPPR